MYKDSLDLRYNSNKSSVLPPISDRIMLLGLSPLSTFFGHGQTFHYPDKSCHLWIRKPECWLGKDPGEGAGPFFPQQCKSPSPKDFLLLRCKDQLAVRPEKSKEFVLSQIPVSSLTIDNTILCECGGLDSSFSRAEFLISGLFLPINVQGYLLYLRYPHQTQSRQSEALPMPPTQQVQHKAVSRWQRSLCQWPRFLLPHDHLRSSKSWAPDLFQELTLVGKRATQIAGAGFQSLGV